VSTAPWQFKPAEIRRAIKSVQSAGLEVVQIEVGRRGQIVINVRPPTPAMQPVAADAAAE
jgi:hypothetical protein